VHVEMAEDHVDILSVIYCNGALYSILNQLKSYDPVRIFFLHSKYLVQLISCRFESSGGVSEAQGVVNMDCEDDNIIICGWTNIDCSIGVSLVETKCSEFFMQIFVPALSRLRETK